MNQFVKIGSVILNTNPLFPKKFIKIGPTVYHSDFIVSIESVKTKIKKPWWLEPKPTPHFEIDTKIVMYVNEHNIVSKDFIEIYTKK